MGPRIDSVAIGLQVHHKNVLLENKYTIKYNTVQYMDNKTGLSQLSETISV